MQHFLGNFPFRISCLPQLPKVLSSSPRFKLHHPIKHSCQSSVNRLIVQPAIKFTSSSSLYTTPDAHTPCTESDLPSSAALSKRNHRTDIESVLPQGLAGRRRWRFGSVAWGLDMLRETCLRVIGASSVFRWVFLGEVVLGVRDKIRR